jgi:hypothetical protein
MSRATFAAWRAALLFAMALAPRPAAAQAWNDARVRALVDSATVRRARQLADTGLKDYKAVAHGYVTFLAQLGDGMAEPPKVVKADELVNEIYWKSPNLSKQRILGRRDTLLLPTDIAYHRDHLGIVQNNFPAIIRLGDGDEVRDVPHPLSPAGLLAYDFAISDSLPLVLPGRTIVLYEVKVRPKDDRAPRIVGAVYIDRDDAQVVRMAFNFTRAAFLDDALEDLFVVVENGLIGTRFWLPRRQEIEIRRGGTWLDYPVRGIIRGRWEIGDYEVNTDLPASLFVGPEIEVASRAAQDTFHFQGRLLDSLPPDVRTVTDADIQRVRTEARALVRAQALQRPQRFLIAASGLSEFVRVDRAEGFAVGGGLATRLGSGVDLGVRARYGIDDRTVKGAVHLGWQTPDAGVRLFAQRDFRDAGDVQERSGVVNSIAAQEFGADATDPFGVQAIGVGVERRSFLGSRWRLELSLERQHALDVRASPVLGAFAPLVAAAPARVQRASFTIDRPTSLFALGAELRAGGELRLSRFSTDDARVPIASSVVRAFGALVMERPYDRGRLVLATTAGVVRGSGGIPAQELLYAGGPVSAPGYAFHGFASRAEVSQQLEWRFPVPAPAIPLGRFGTVPGRATLAPFLHALYRRPVGSSDYGTEGLYPSAGIALQPFFDLLRIQLARGLRDGGWRVNVDVSREFWSVL